MKTIRGVGLITLMCGVSTLIPQYLVAVNLGAELPAFAGSLVSLIVIVFMAKNRKEKIMRKVVVAALRANKKI